MRLAATNRSYVLRTGRMTLAQKRALDQHFATFGLSDKGPIDLDKAYGRRAPRCLEIGFGMGDALLELARRHPERDYLGIEVYPPGIGHLLANLALHGLTNVRIMRGDAQQALAHCFSAPEFDTILLFFPDPWPKKRHHKRRLVQPAFIDLVADRLTDRGVFHLATDWVPYAEHAVKVLQQQGRFRNLSAPAPFSPRPASRPETKFERRGAKLGHEVRDLLFERLPRRNA